MKFVFVFGLQSCSISQGSTTTLCTMQSEKSGEDSALMPLDKKTTLSILINSNGKKTDTRTERQLS